MRVLERERPENDRIGELSGREKKRLFVGLVMGTSVLVCLALALLWVIPYYGLAAIHPIAPWTLLVLVSAVVLIVAWASLGLVLNILFGKTLPLFMRMRGVTVRLFLPLMTLVGRALGISKDRVRSSFIRVNNELVASTTGTFAPEELLLLMPHCLQRSDCRIKLTSDVRNCERCGRCPIAGLLDLSDRYGVDMAVATGGTIARSLVVRKRPRLILAVACERDLASGIQDTHPLPAYGVLNDRPHGPCLNTLVSHAEIEAGIRRFLDSRYVPAKTGTEAVSAVASSRR